MVPRIENGFYGWNPLTLTLKAGDLRKGQPVSVVTPAKAGVQEVFKGLDSGFRRNPDDERKTDEMERSPETGTCRKH